MFPNGTRVELANQRNQCQTSKPLGPLLRSRGARGLLTACLVAAASLAPAPSASAAPVERPDRTEALPKRLEGVDVDEQLGTTIPLNIGFRDEEGQPVTLQDYFDGSVPVVLTLNYSDCPMLCSLELNGLVEGLKKVDWTAGKEFRIVTISIDPKEQPERARKTKNRYLSQYGRPGAEPGWHFLTGSESNIQAVADSVGFRYGYNEKRKEYVHPAAVVFLSPSAKVARYLYGIEYDPRTLRLTLAEASEGKIGTSVDRFILFCFHYDANEGRYAPVARNIMKLGGAVAVVIFGAFFAALWLAEHRKKKLTQAQT